MGIDDDAPHPAAGTVKAPYRSIDFAPPRVERRPLAGGGFDLVSPIALEPYEQSLAHMLRRQAKTLPEAPFLAERDFSGAWRRLSYRDAGRHADALAQALLDRGCGPRRPLMILSGNGIEHALLTLGAFVGGVPAVPVSVAYSLMSQDHERLSHIFTAVKPAVVYVSVGTAFAKALAALDLEDVRLIVGVQPPEGLLSEPFGDLLNTAPGPQVEQAFAGVGPDTIAKILFTSGSTGLPKGVINTHRMLCSNQRMIEQIWPFLKCERPVLVDWLPWNHTFGANHNFNLVLANGGTLHVDAGRPTADFIHHTIRNLSEISPTIYFNVPAGFSMLLPHLENDERLARNFFSRLRLIFYAGASLSQDLWERLEALSTRITGLRVPMVSSWGATETAPAVTGGHLLVDQAGVIGLPLPGVTLQFIPNGTKLEMRVRGPNVFPGYFRREDQSREAFDEAGFYKVGDAGRLADPDHPAKGVVFDGRVAEDFKLATGTWVHVGGLRVAALAAAAPALQDAVVTGHDRDFVGLMAWPSLTGLKRICNEAPTETAGLAQAPKVIAYIRDAIAAHNARQIGTSTIIRRVLLMQQPPSIDANEITDKGYINQRVVLEHRRDLVDLIYAEPPAAGVLIIA